MASAYARYVKERTNDFILETDFGFATYRYLYPDGGVPSVYIVDIYVEPEHRKEGYAAMMADDIAAEARKKGCMQLFGSVMPSAKNSTDSLRVLLSYGMRLDSAGPDTIFFKKDI